MVENLTAKAVYFAWGSIRTFLFEASAGSVRVKIDVKQENPISALFATLFRLGANKTA